MYLLRYLLKLPTIIGFAETDLPLKPNPKSLAYVGIRRVRLSCGPSP